MRDLALSHADDAIDDATYLEQTAALRQQRAATTDGERASGPSGRVVAWLRAFGEAIQSADPPAERADLIHAVYEQIVVGRTDVRQRSPNPAAYQHGMALALPQVVMARPTGVGRALATYTIPIEGRDEWVAAAKRLA